MAKDKKSEGKMESLLVPRPNFEVMEIEVGNIAGSPLLVHAFSQKTITDLKEQDGNRGKRALPARDPMKEARDALYLIPGEGDESYGLPAAGFKKAMQTVAKDLPGKRITGAMVMRQIYVFADVAGLVRMRTKNGWHMREDIVRLRNGSPQIRYRPEFDDWRCTLRIRYDADIFDPQSILNLLSRAGFTVGWGERRMEKGYECGGFELSAKNAKISKVEA